jgi:molybdate transport system regulatory protein
MSLTTRTTLVRFRIDFSENCSIGPGKVELLESIRTLGSLSGAARKLKMSYRYAWLLLNNLNTSFREPVVRASTGGKSGGGTTLTAFGEKLVSTYRNFEQEVEKGAAYRLSSLAQMAASPPSRRMMRRRLALTAASSRATRKSKTSRN